MSFWFYFVCLWVADYLYFKIRYTKSDGPPTWYFFPFLGVVPFYLLPRFLFKFGYRYYLRNFPDVMLTRFLVLPCVLVKNSAIQDVQNSDHCLSRPSFRMIVGPLTTGKSVWSLADNNTEGCPWPAIRKANVSALNFLPKHQKFKRTSDAVDNFLKTIEHHQDKLWDYKDELSFAKAQESSNVNLGMTFEVNNIQSALKYLSKSLPWLPFTVLMTAIIPLRVHFMLESFYPPLFRPTVLHNVYHKVNRRLVELRAGRVGEPRDFVEATLRVKEPEAAVEFLREVMFINMLASTHTTQHSTMAALSYVSLDKRVQEKIHEELDRVVGSSPLTLDHLSDLHYLRAVIQETNRMNAPLPLIRRLTNAPVRIGGYMVESNSYVVMSVQSEGLDPKNFRDPESFIPERHITADGRFEDNKLFDIFSRGKRRCAGIDVARMSVQVHCAKIFQHFEIQPERPDMEVPGYSGSSVGDCPMLPLRFVRRAGSPAIEPARMETGLLALITDVINEEISSPK